jgi:hypothetical protein
VRYSWPGNVRELENACERIAQTCSCGTVRVGCMSASILFRAGAQPVAAAPIAPSASGMTGPPDTKPISLDDRLKEVEANLIGWALKVSGGNSPRRRSCYRSSVRPLGIGSIAAVWGESKPKVPHRDRRRPLQRSRGLRQASRKEGVRGDDGCQERSGSDRLQPSSTSRGGAGSFLRTSPFC